MAKTFGLKHQTSHVTQSGFCRAEVNKFQKQSIVIAGTPISSPSLGCIFAFKLKDSL
ncbi:unnamed protein product [Acidithrix sp. C25]|nr:unnamed protein product [Acidithrix sp. C25]